MCNITKHLNLLLLCLHVPNELKMILVWRKSYTPGKQRRRRNTEDLAILSLWSARSISFYRV